jgi:hypothetical protein
MHIQYTLKPQNNDPFNNEISVIFNSSTIFVDFIVKSP